MHCIECGLQIPNNSKFCAHCGQKQREVETSIKEKIAEVIIEKEIERQIVAAQKTSIDFQFLLKAMGLYLAWVALHLGILLVFSESIFATENSYDMNKFVPFSERSEIENYDFREFLMYTIFPLIILIIWSMLRSPEQIRIKTGTLINGDILEIYSNTSGKILPGMRATINGSMPPDGIYQSASTGLKYHIANGVLISTYKPAR